MPAASTSRSSITRSRAPRCWPLARLCPWRKKRTIAVTAVDRVMFAVDYPFSRNEEGRTFLDGLPVSAADKDKIAHSNAERLLGLSRI